MTNGHREADRQYLHLIKTHNGLWNVDIIFSIAIFENQILYIPLFVVYIVPNKKHMWWPFFKCYLFKAIGLVLRVCKITCIDHLDIFVLKTHHSYKNFRKFIHFLYYFIKQSFVLWWLRKKLSFLLINKFLSI